MRRRLPPPLRRTDTWNLELRTRTWNPEPGTRHLMIALALLLAANTSSSCDSLRSLSTPQTTVMSADVVPAGVFVPPPAPPPPPGTAPAAAAGRAGGRGARAGGAPPAPPEPIPQHCRVKLTLKPTP